jgi:hypothetical protein
MRTLYVKGTKISTVSPADGYVSLALVKHSNKGGLGPRYNMKEDPGSSTLIMLKVHGCHLYLMPGFPEAGDKNHLALPSGYQSKPGKAPSRPLKYTLHPMQRCQQRPGSVEITLQPLIQGWRPWIGQGMGVETILGFSARLYEVRQLS